MLVKACLFIILISVCSFAADPLPGSIVTKFRSTPLLILATQPETPATWNQVQQKLNQSGQLVRFVSMQPGKNRGQYEINQYRDDWVSPRSDGPIRRTIGMVQRVYDPGTHSSMTIDLTSRSGRKFRSDVETIAGAILPEVVSFQDRQAVAEYQRQEFQQHFQQGVEQKKQYIEELRRQSQGYEQRQQQQSNLGMAELGANLAAALDANSALTLEEQRAREEAAKLANHQLRNAEYEYNYSAAQMIENALKVAAEEKRYQEMSELAEALTYGKIDGKYNKSKILQNYARSDGVLKVGGTFDHANFKTEVHSSYGQAIRRLANRYQSLWAQSNGLAVLSPAERARYILGTTAISLADHELAKNEIDDVDLHRSAGLLSFAQSMADSVAGFGSGVAESVEALVKAVPELAVLAGHGVYNLFTDPVAAWNMTCDFVMKLPEVGGLAMAVLAKDYNQLKNGNAYEKGEVLGRYALDVVATFASAGAGAAAKGASVGTRVGELGAVLAKTVPAELRTRAALAMKSSAQILDKMPAPVRNGLIKAANKNIEAASHLSEAYIKAARTGQTQTVQYLEKVAAVGINIGDTKNISKIAKAHSNALKALDDIPGVSRDTLVSRAISKDVVENGVKKTLTPDDVFKKHGSQVTTDHRYTIGGPMGNSGLYMSEGSIAEASATLLRETGKNASDLIMAEKRIKYDSLLDLTNEDTLRKLSLDRKLIESERDYSWTQMIGDAAKQKGYDGIIFKSTKGPLDNIVIFN